MHLKAMKLFVVIFLSLNLAVSFAKGRDHHRHKNHCKKSEFKSWDQLKNSKSIEYLEDESSIVIETNCKIKLHKDFSFSTQKDLSIKAKEMQIKKDSSLTAGRLLIETEKEFKLEKRSNLCADVFILEAKKKELKGDICASAVLLGSSFDAPSALAVLEVSLDQDKAPVQAVFDWSKSFGLFESASIDFGDGSSQVVSEKSFVKVYENAGDFIAQLALQTANGEVLSNAIEIKVEQRNPIVDFGVWHVIRRGGTPPEVWLAPNLYPLVEEPEQIKEYRWLFGDGSSLVMPFAESPDGFVVHTFPEMGVYNVEVEAVTVSGASKKASLTIDLNNPSVPVPKYRVSSFKGEAPFTVTFTGEAYDEAGETITYNWYFYDTGEQFFGEQFQEVTHTFNNSGVNYVYLETRDNLRGRRVTYIPIYVGEVPGSNGVAPVAIVESTSRFGEGPLTIDFSGIRSFDPSGNTEGLSYYWNFGDFRSGALNEAFTANAQHTFNQPGAYFVNLVVTNAEGMQHSEFTLVTVDGPEVNDIDFEVTPTGNLYEYNFSAYGYFEETDYLQVSARWGFGDGTYLTYEPNVNHQYQGSGVYDVELKLRRPDGDYDSYTRRLTVAENQQTSYAQIEKQSEWFNLGQPVQMRANFNQGISSDKTIYRWSMGDGSIIKGQGDAFKSIVHTYFEEGDKNIKLTLTDDNGLTSTTYNYIKENRYAPEIDGLPIYFTENPAPVTVAFQPYETSRDLDGNFSHYIYEFGDGSLNIQTTDGYQEHRYETAGTYTVAVSVFDTLGLSSRFERELIIKENQPPTLADFNIYYSNNPAPAVVGFEAWPYFNDVDGFDNQHYEFIWGDGTSEIANTGYREHTYQVGGDYEVSIRAQDNSGNWSNYVKKTISIVTNQAPILAYVPVYGQPDQPAPTNVAFAPWEGATDDQGIARYTYDFNDGSPLLDTTDGYVEHIFTSAGTFNVVITAYDFYGLSDSFTIPLTIKENQPPVISDFNLTIPAQRAPVSVSLDASPFAFDPDGYISSYEINWGNGDIVQSQSGYIEYTYNTAGEYVISVRVQDNYGQWSELATKTASIIGNQAPLAKIVADKTAVLVPDTIHLSALESSDPENDPLVYEWTLPNGTISTEAEINFELIEAGEQTIALKVTDSFGAETSTSIVLEGKLPFGNTIILTKSSDIAPSTLTMQPQKLYDDNGNPLTFEWLVNGEKKSEEANFSYTVNEPGDVEIQLTSIDDDGFKYQTQLIETLNAAPLYFTLNRDEAYAPLGDSVEFQLIGLILGSPDYEIEIISNDPNAVIENINTNTFKITSMTSGTPIEVNVSATNGVDLYERQAVVEFVVMQEIFSQTVASNPMSVEYQGETLMQVSSPVEGNIFAKLGNTSKGEMIVEVSSHDINPKRISILGLNPNYSVTASQFVSSFHMGENIDTEKVPVNNFSRDWVKVCHTPDPDAKRTIFKFDPDNSPDLVDPIRIRELVLENGDKVQIGFRNSLSYLFFNEQDNFNSPDTPLDENADIVIELKKAFEKIPFTSLVPVWILSMNDPFLNTKSIKLQKNNEEDEEKEREEIIDGYVSSHLQVVHVFKEAILREGFWADKKDYYPFFLLAHEYRHIEQYDNCDFINNLTKFDAISGTVIAESSADLDAMKKVASLPDDGAYAQVSEYVEVRSPLGLNPDLRGSIISDGILDEIGSRQQYGNELFFDLIVDDEFQFARKVVEKSANTSHISLLQNFINTPEYDYPELVANYLTSFSDRYSRLGFDIHQASLNPIGLDTATNIGPYGFGYLKIPAWNIQEHLVDHTLKLRVLRSADVEFLALPQFYANQVGSLGSIEESKFGNYSDLKIAVNPETLYGRDGFFGVANNSWMEPGKFRVVMINDRCVSGGDIGLPQPINDKLSSTYKLVKTFENQDAQFSLPVEVVEYFETNEFKDNYIVDYYYQYDGKRYKMKNEQDFNVAYYRDGHNVISSLLEQGSYTNIDIVISKKNIDTDYSSALCKTFFKRIELEDIYPLVEFIDPVLIGEFRPDNNKIKVKISFPTLSQYPNTNKTNFALNTEMQIVTKNTYDIFTHSVSLNIGEINNIDLPLVSYGPGSFSTYNISFNLPSMSGANKAYSQGSLVAFSREVCLHDHAYSDKRLKCGKIETSGPNFICTSSLTSNSNPFYSQWGWNCTPTPYHGTLEPIAQGLYWNGLSTGYVSSDCIDCSYGPNGEPPPKPPVPQPVNVLLTGTWYDYVNDIEVPWTFSDTIYFSYP